MMMKALVWIGVGLAFMLSCTRASTRISTAEFANLTQQVADAWTQRNTEAALACFTTDAVYYQPPDEQFYQGHAQLKPYFDALKEGTFMRIHHTWFDEASQRGAIEFTFGNTATDTGVSGVVVITVKDGKIAEWREYFIAGPLDFKEFSSTEGKEWKWHIGNYP